LPTCGIPDNYGMNWSNLMPDLKPKQPQPDLLKHFAKDDTEARLKALRLVTAPQRVAAWAALVGSVAAFVGAAKFWH
jgi:hypothetical protein